MTENEGIVLENDERVNTFRSDEKNLILQKKWAPRQVQIAQGTF